MLLSRRQFMQALGLSCLTGAIPTIAQHTSAATLGNTRNLDLTETLISSVNDSQGRSWLGLSDNKGNRKLLLPGRAHQVVLKPDNREAAVIARRPGKWTYIVDLENLKIKHELLSPRNMHGFGHAVFSADGRYLISAENDLSVDQGRVTIRDAQDDYRVLDVHSSYGVGPHQLALLSDQQTLVIANGGILTRPETGREKLNLDSMTPSLVYMNLASGRLLEKHELDKSLHKLSIRHLDVNQNNEVVIAMQHQGAMHELVPLIGHHRLGRLIELPDLPEQSLIAMKQYCGSICFDDSGDYYAVSAPRGDRLIIMDMRANRLFDELRCRDVCGLAASSYGGFWLSSGTGRVYHYTLSNKKLEPSNLSNSAWHWDNHMTMLSS